MSRLAGYGPRAWVGVAALACLLVGLAGLRASRRHHREEESARTAAMVAEKEQARGTRGDGARRPVAAARWQVEKAVAPVAASPVVEGVLAGMVVDGNDQPVSGALVRLGGADLGSGSGGAGGGGGGEDGATTPTDARGVFEFDAAGWRASGLSATHGEFGAVAREVKGGARGGEGGTSVAVVLRFPVGHDLVVRVSAGAEEKPVEGAAVSVGFYRGLAGASMVVRSDEKGMARARALPVEAARRVGVSHKDYAPWEQAWVSTTGTVVEARLEALASVTVTLDPVPRLGIDDAKRVLLLRQSGLHENDKPWEPPGWEFEVAAEKPAVDGRARFERVRAGIYLAAVPAKGGLAQQSGYVMPGQEAEFTVKWAASGSASGIVSDRETSKPIAGATVVAQMWVSAPVEATASVATTDAAGRFRIDGLPVGWVDLTARFPTYPEAKRRVDVTEVEGPGIELLMSNRKSSLRGVVRSGDKVVSGALVELYGTDGNGGDYASGYSQTDGEGRYLIEGVGPGAYNLLVSGVLGDGTADAKRVLPAKVGEEATSLDVTLVPEVPVEGMVTVGGMVAGSSAGGGAVQVMATPLDGQGESKAFEAQGDGKFEGTLAPGRYSFTLQDRPGIEVRVAGGKGGETARVKLDY